MGFDRKKIKQIYKMILLVALLVLGIIYIKETITGIKMVFRILTPFIMGAVIAFILNLLMRGIETKLLKKWSGKIARKCKRPVSILLSIVSVLLIIFLMIIIVVPQLVDTVAELGKAIPVFVDNLVNDIIVFSNGYPEIQEYLSDLENIKIDWNSILTTVGRFLKNGMSDVMSSTFSIAGSIAGGVMNFFIGFIFAIYILGQKETLASQGERIIKAYLKPEKYEKVMKICRLLYDNFSNFISGQCLEALILGSIFVVVMTIFRLPYAVMIGVLIAFTALIPVVGAFIGCFIGTFLMLVDEPRKAIFFLILFLVIQQIEGNLIYPKVVGDKVGLPSIWVLVAVTVGGSLFGVAGMLVFIPIVSTLYTLLKEDVNHRNSQSKK